MKTASSGLCDPEAVTAPVRESRDERHRREQDEAAARYAAERRLQVVGLLLLAAAVLVGTVLHAGVRNVFLPGWWRFW